MLSGVKWIESGRPFSLRHYLSAPIFVGVLKLIMQLILNITAISVLKNDVWSMLMLQFKNIERDNVYYAYCLCPTLVKKIHFYYQKNGLLSTT
jgi:hypothetical protein